jgi:hypothetical protein
VEFDFDFSNHRTAPKKRRKVAKKKKQKRKKLVTVQAEVVERPQINSGYDSDLVDLVSEHFWKSEDLPEDPNELPDAVEILKQAIDANFDTSIFADHALPTAPNIYEWIKGRDFLAANTTPFPKQFQHLVHFTCDVCYFCSDTEYIFDVPVDAHLGDVLDHFVLLQHGVCPICQRNRLEILQEWIVDPRYHKYNIHLEDNALISPYPPNEICCVWGQRSGKSHIMSSYVPTYLLHRYLALPDPMNYFNEPSNKVIEATFVAPVLKQVNTYMWSPLRDAIANSPWFKNTIGYFKQEGRRLGVSLFSEAKSYMLFPGKRLAVHISAANSTNLRGGTRILVVIDELGWFNVSEDGKKRTNIADGGEVFKSCDNSLLTLRGAADERRERGDYNTVDAWMANISSPSSVGDPIMQRSTVAEQNNRIYFDHAATFEINPRWTEKRILEVKAGEPIEKIKRDFYAIPPAAASPFFSDETILEDLVFPASESFDSLFGYRVTTVDDEFGTLLLRPELVDVKPERHTPRLLAVDNGEKKNSFALTMGSYIPELEGLFIEEIVEVTPHDGKVVDLAWAYDEFIVPLSKAFNLLRVGFDNWQSSHAFYDLRTKQGVKADRIRLKWKDFEDFREDLIGNKIRYREPEVSIKTILNTRNLAMRSLHPRAHFLAQMLTVEVFGKKLHKPTNGNDDTFRTVVLCHHLMKKNEKELKKRTRRISKALIRGGSVGCRRANKLLPTMFNLPSSLFSGGGGAPKKPGGPRGTQPGASSVGVSSAGRRGK